MKLSRPSDGNFEVSLTFVGDTFFVRENFVGASTRIPIQRKFFEQHNNIFAEVDIPLTLHEPYLHEKSREFVISVLMDFYKIHFGTPDYIRAVKVLKESDAVPVLIMSLFEPKYRNAAIEKIAGVPDMYLSLLTRSLKRESEKMRHDEYLGEKDLNRIIRYASGSGVHKVLPFFKGNVNYGTLRGAYPVIDPNNKVSVAMWEVFNGAGGPGPDLSITQKRILKWLQNMNSVTKLFEEFKISREPVQDLSAMYAGSSGIEPTACAAFVTYINDGYNIHQKYGNLSKKIKPCINRDSIYKAYQESRVNHNELILVFQKIYEDDFKGINNEIELSTKSGTADVVLNGASYVLDGFNIVSRRSVLEAVGFLNGHCIGTRPDGKGRLFFYEGSICAQVDLGSNGFWEVTECRGRFNIETEESKDYKKRLEAALPSLKKVELSCISDPNLVKNEEIPFDCESVLKQRYNHGMLDGYSLETHMANGSITQSLAPVSIGIGEFNSFNMVIGGKTLSTTVLSKTNYPMANRSISIGDVFSGVDTEADDDEVCCDGF